MKKQSSTWKVGQDFVFQFLADKTLVGFHHHYLGTTHAALPLQFLFRSL